MDIKAFLQSLVTEKIVDAETSDRIYAHFLAQKAKEKLPAQPQKSDNTLMIVIGTIGVILFGIGVIYLFAHNWDNLSRTTKVLLSFTPVVLSILANIFTVVKRNGNRVWEESTAISTFLAVGSMLALLLQIYQLPGIQNYFFFMWAALSIPVIYLLRSHVGVFLALALILLNLTSQPIDQSAIYRLPWFGSLMLFTTLIPYYRRLFLLKAPRDIYIIQQIALPLVVFFSMIVSIHASEFTIWFIAFLTLANLHLFGTSHLLKNANRTPAILSIITYSGLSISLSYLLFREDWDFEGIFTTAYSDHREIFIPLLLLLACIQLFLYFRKERIGLNNLYKWLVFVPLPFILLDPYIDFGRSLYQYFALAGIVVFLTVGKKLQQSFIIYPSVSFLAVLIMSFFSFKDTDMMLFFAALIPGVFLISSFSSPEESGTKSAKGELIAVVVLQVMLLITASFEGFWKSYHWESDNPLLPVLKNSADQNTLIVLTVLVIAYQFYTISDKAMRFAQGVPFWLSIVTPAIILPGCLQLFPIHHIITVLLLAGGIVAVIAGARRSNLLVANLGLTLVGITLFCRFLDIQMSLTLKGIIFILIGLSFFFANYQIVKNKKPKA